MKRLFTLRKFFLFVGFIISLQSFASLIGSSIIGRSNGDDDDRNKKISLKNFNKNYYKTTAYPSFKLSQFQYKGSQNIYQINAANSMEGQSMISFQNGNTTYVYPYKYKVKVPFFKTPVSPNHVNH